MYDGFREDETAVLNLKIGDHVHYGAHGVCQVCGREARRLGGEEQVYFTLRPTGSENILLYLPENAEPEKVRLRPLMSRQEILTMLDRTRCTPAEWIADSKLRRETFTRVLRQGDVEELIRMLKCIYQHQAALPQGKQLPMSDQEMRQAAQRQLYSEMAYVLSIDESQIQSYILEQVAERPAE